MKFYILCHHRLSWLKAHARTIPYKDQVVVINSLNDGFVDMAVDYCKQKKIEYHITESDGTAATGKNALIKVFLESDNQYMVQVDGDDEISEYGYEFYKNVSERDNPPDMIIIYNQWQKQTLSFKYDKNGNSVPHEVGKVQPSNRFLKDFESGVFELEGVAARIVENQKLFSPTEKIPPELLKKWAENRVMWEKFVWDHGEGTVERRHEKRDGFQRMVFYSKKAAEMIKFDNSLKIGEDFMAMLHMKKLHKEGKIKMARHDEDVGCKNPPRYTYIYQYDRVGVVRSYMEKSEEYPELYNYSWYVELGDYMKKHNIVEKYKDIIQNEIPDIV